MEWQYRFRGTPFHEDEYPDEHCARDPKTDD